MQMIADETGLKQLIYMVLGWRISLTHRRGMAHSFGLTFISDYDNDMAIHVYVHNNTQRRMAFDTKPVRNLL